MRHAIVAAVAVSAAAFAVQASTPHPSADPVIAAERAFAARGQEVPVKQAFLDFAAPDGVLVDSERGAENALRTIAGWPDRANAGYIKWWPLYAGIASSGELGFTTGAATYGDNERFTHYFTVWKKQPDGSWKWLIDMGSPADAVSPFGPETTPQVAPPAPVRGRYPESAWRTLDETETALVDEARTNLAAAYGRRLAPEGRIMGMEGQPSVGRAAWSRALAARPKSVSMKPLGGGVSKSGDFGWTYGSAAWTADGRRRQGTYLRAWQLRRDGWVILADTLTADRP